MQDRMGEKIGWSAGWAGGFIWVLALSVVFLFQGKIEEGVSGLSLVGISIFVIFYFSPWRFASTPYWKLMLAPYGVFFLSITWAVWSYGGFSAVGFDWWNLLWLLPALIPFGSLSEKRWSDSIAQPGAAGINM